MRLRSHISISVACAFTAVLVLGACSDSSSRQRNSVVDEQPPVVSTYPFETLTYPINLAVDDSGNVYTANLVSTFITKISADGSIDNKWASVGRSDTYGIDVDGNGNVFAINFSSGQLQKFSTDGSLLNSVNVGSGAIDVVVDELGTAFVVNQNSASITGMTTSGEAFSEPVTSRAVGITVDKTGVVYMAHPSANIVSSWKQGSGTIKTWEVGSEPIAVTMVPSGDVFVAHRQQRYVSQINTQTDEITKIDIGQVYNITDTTADSSGNVYILDEGGSVVYRISSAGTVSSPWATTGGQPHSIAVGKDGSVYTANLTGNSVTKIVPAVAAGMGDTTPTSEVVADEELKTALVPTFGNVVRTDGGFRVDITNLDDAFTYAAQATSGGTASIETTDASHEVVVSGLAPNTEATVEIKTSRAGYAPGSAEISGNSLDVGTVPAFGDPVSTQDGFTVQITNFDPNFTYGATSSDGEVRVDNSGMVTVKGLSAVNKNATVIVTTSRDGYVSTDSEVAGSILAAKKDDAVEAPPTSSMTQSTTENSSVTSVVVSTTSIEESTTSVEESTTSAEDSPTTVAAQIVSKNDVLIQPQVISQAVVASESAPEGVVVSVKTTEVVCGAGCVGALLGATGITDGEVTVTIGDAVPIALSIDNHIKLKVGSKDTVMKFTVTATDGKETVVNVPVTHSASVLEPAG